MILACYGLCLFVKGGFADKKETTFICQAFHGLLHILDRYVFIYRLRPNECTGQVTGFQELAGKFLVDIKRLRIEILGGRPDVIEKVKRRRL